MKKLDFLLIGAQKSGTTALASYLAGHAGICMSEPKEAHAFDYLELRGLHTRARLDEYYQKFFPGSDPLQLWGEATPVYLYMTGIAEKIHNYNPDIKLLVILRDPVERALSHYRMSRERGVERWPFWLALLLEPLRLWREGSTEDATAAFRHFSYRSRGLYAAQLKTYLDLFPKDQLLVLRSEDLLTRHESTLAKAYRFLGLPNQPPQSAHIVNSSTTSKIEASKPLRFLLRSSFRRDLKTLAELTGLDTGNWQ